MKTSMQSHRGPSKSLPEKFGKRDKEEGFFEMISSHHYKLETFMENLIPAEVLVLSQSPKKSFEIQNRT